MNKSKVSGHGRAWGVILMAACVFLSKAGAQNQPETAPVAKESAAEISIPEREPSGTWVRDMNLNEFMQVISERMEMQYFANPELKDMTVTGYLRDDGETVEALRDIVLPYGAEIYSKGRTLYALTASQQKLLPRQQWTYSLKYLRGSTREEQDQLIEMVRPALSESGSLRFEQKTGTVVILDHENAVRAAKQLLERIDVPRRQVVVDVKILRLFDVRGRRTGVDWSKTLGAQGLTVGLTAAGPLNEIFNTVPVFGSASQLAQQAANVLANNTAGAPVSPVDGSGVEGSGDVVAAGSANAGIILNPVQIEAVLRFLVESDLARQESGPAVITEDNEQAIFRVVDRIPIVEQTVTQSDGVNNISTDVRYRIDPEDPVDPAHSREVGVSITVTPSLLPDGTIRMRLFPRVATVTSYVKVSTGVNNIYNEYPRVNETSVEAIARIPDGYSLLLGGYYQNEIRQVDNKVPLLGDIPGLSFAFRSKQREKVKSNIVFIITPTAYQPASPERTVEFTEMLRQNLEAPPHYLHADDEAPRETTRPNLLQGLRNLNPFGRKPQREVSGTVTENPPADGKIKTSQQGRQEKLKAKIRGGTAQ